MNELRESYDSSENGTPTGVENGVSNAVVPKNGVSKNGISAVNRIWGGDKRIALFGYTLETINLLLLPMIKTK